MGDRTDRACIAFRAEAHAQGPQEEERKFPRTGAAVTTAEDPPAAGWFHRYHGGARGAAAAAAAADEGGSPRPTQGLSACGHHDYGALAIQGSDSHGVDGDRHDRRTPAAASRQPRELGQQQRRLTSRSWQKARRWATTPCGRRQRPTDPEASGGVRNYVRTMGSSCPAAALHHGLHRVWRGIRHQCWRHVSRGGRLHVSGLQQHRHRAVQRRRDLLLDGFPLRE